MPGRSLEPRRSTLDRLDDWLLVGVIAVVAVLALQVLGWVFGAIVFLVKVAVVAAVVGLVVAYINRRH